MATDPQEMQIFSFVSNDQLRTIIQQHFPTIVFVVRTIVKAYGTTQTRQLEFENRLIERAVTAVVQAVRSKDAPPLTRRRIASMVHEALTSR